MYEVGRMVEVQCQFGNKNVVVRGKVMLKPRWLRPQDIAIATGNPDFPMAVVNTDYVVSASKPVQKTEGRTFRVKSKENTYLVTYLNNKYSCNCIGFGYHHHCKHVTAVQKKIAESA